MSIATRYSFRKLAVFVCNTSVFIRQIQHFFRQCCKATAVAFIGFVVFTFNASAQSFIESVEQSRRSMPPIAKPQSASPTTTISNLSDFSGATPVGNLRCNPSPVFETFDRMSPQRSACDAPIVHVISTLDTLATKIGERCLPALYSKLPDYAKDLKVLGALATGNPIALGFALGATVESDLRECGLEGVMDGLPVSDSVRSDLRDVHAAIKTSKEYLSLKDNMAKILSLKDQPIDAATLTRDVRDAYLGHKEVEGLGNEITKLGKGLAARYKDAAKDITALEKGVDGLQGLVRKAAQATQSQEDLAQQIRGIARSSVQQCQIEAADKQLVSAGQKAERALLQSRQAIANARELQSCTYALIEGGVGSSSNVLRAASFIKGLQLRVKRFYDLVRDINGLEKDIARQATLLKNIGRQCKILHDESGRIQHMLDTYAEIKSAIQERLDDLAFCDFNNLVDRVSLLEGIEEDRCSLRLPTTSKGGQMSASMVQSILSRKRNIDVDRQLYSSLRSEVSRAIRAQNFRGAEQRLRNMEKLARSKCIDGREISTIRERIRAAVNSRNNPVHCTGPKKPGLDLQPATRVEIMGNLSNFAGWTCFAWADKCIQCPEGYSWTKGTVHDDLAAERDPRCGKEIMVPTCR